MNKRTTIGLLGSVMLVVAACGGSGDGGPAGGPGANVPLTEHCSGTYTCELPGYEPISTTLTRYEGQCYAGEALLTDDGFVDFGDGSLSTWSGNAYQFSICIEGECLACTSDDAPAPKQPKGGKCSGSARSCSSFSPGSCVQEGCSMQFKVRWDGELEAYCGGYADSCSDFDTDWECENQVGCYWE